MVMTEKDADTMEGAGGRQYHIGLAPGELAERILLCGDPNRAERVSKLFDELTHEVREREYVTFTGKHRGLDVSVMSTGIGPDNTEIALVELSRITSNPVLIRIGSCGGLQDCMELGDLVVSTGAVRLENTSDAYAHPKYPAVADPEVHMALLRACVDKGFKHHSGITVTAPGFYAAQSRRMDDFPTRWDDVEPHMAALGAANYEMESSVLFTLAGIKGFRAGTVCAVYATRHAGKGIDKETKLASEGRCIDAGLRALEILDTMDKEKAERGLRYWVP